MNLRVMTYNIRAFKDDRAALQQVIRGAAPDVLLLQEVPRHPLSDHRIAAFAESLGMFWGGGARHRMSTTLFTAPRVDVHASGHGLYTVPRPQEPRGYGWAEVSLGDSGRIVAISTHVTLYEAQRAGHAEELFADENLRDDLPWVLGGDFNEGTDGPFSQVVSRRLGDVGSRSFTSTAENPTKRIDFVYASPQLAVTPVEIDTLVDVADLGRATDHRPVLVDVELPR